MLANLLANRRTTRASAPRVLQVYSQARQPAVTRVAALSRQNGLLFSLSDPAKSLSELAHRIQQSWDEAHEGDPLADVRRALDMLETALG
jgi:2-polyprenyl-6-methoxyphenol hydroxylase-like FAD-dependent oxidoreductase